MPPTPPLLPRSPAPPVFPARPSPAAGWRRPSLLLAAAALMLAPASWSQAPPSPPPVPAAPVSPGPTPGAPDPALASLIEAAGAACRAALARRFATAPQQLEIWLVPGLAIAIEAGERNLAAVRRDGLDFGWMVHGKPDPLPIGVCRTDGGGSLRSIAQQPD